MKTLVKIITVSLLGGLTTLGFASPTAELNLWKHDPFFYGSCGHCADFVPFKENQDRADFMEFGLYMQTGYYSVVLYGPGESTITLFGEKNFATDRGFLVIVKKDDSIVQIADLENFPAEQWVTVEAVQGGSGAYSAYYQPFPNFKNNVRSGRWGKWWEQLPPATSPVG